MFKKLFKPIPRLFYGLALIAIPCVFTAPFALGFALAYVGAIVAAVAVSDIVDKIRKHDAEGYWLMNIRTDPDTMHIVEMEEPTFVQSRTIKNSSLLDSYEDSDQDSASTTPCITSREL